MRLDKVIYGVEDSIARIVMNRPEKRNAPNHALLDDLDEALAEADDNSEVRVVILSSARLRSGRRGECGATTYSLDIGLAAVIRL